MSSLIANEEQIKVLMKHNYLITAKYDLGLIENRIFVYFLYKAQKQGERNVVCKITQKELREIVRDKRKQSFKKICEIFEGLRKETISILEKKPDGSIDYIIGGIFNDVVFNDTTFNFELIGSERIYRLLLDDHLKEGYTPINLQAFMMLPTTYSQKLYDLIRKWSGKKNKITYTIKELRELLMIKEGKYKEYKDFKKRIIVDSVNRLNTTGLFELTYEEVRQGRNVVAVTFIVRDKDKRIYFDKKENVKEITELELVEELIINSKNFKTFLTKTALKKIEEQFYMYNADDNVEIFIKSLEKTFKYTKTRKIRANGNFQYFSKVLKTELYEYGTLNISTKDEILFDTHFKNDDIDSFFENMDVFYGKTF